MKKRLLSFALSISIVVSLFSTVFVKTYAEETYVSSDVAILENILNGDRHFVIDTLIGTNYKTDFSTNPHAIVNYIGNENTMMDNVLTQYQTDRVYKAAVDIMEKVYNSDEYAESTADFIAEFAADLLSNFSTDAGNFVSDLSYSKSQLNYESILKETLSSDYTASDGTELSTKEIELENLERIEKGVKNLKSFSNFFKSNASANHMNDDTFDDRMKYYNDYLIPYTDNMNSVLSAFADMQDSKGKSDEQKKEDMVNFVTFLAMLNQMDRYEQANTDIESDIVYYAPTFFVSDEALSLIKSGDKAISTVSKTLSTYMFIESIATQSDSMKGALTRMARTANPSLKPVLNTFANEIGEAGNQKLIAYESLMQYIRNAGVVKELEQNTGKFITKQISKRLPQVQALSKEGLLRTAASKAISDATAVVGISSWCADKTMSFGDTCKKTYELKYLRTLIAQAVCTYQDDLTVYNSNKTETNAKAVLDDLLLIQKLRLRGETIAYKMTQGQWNSPLGRILATGTLNPDDMLMEYLDSSYQARVDAFIGASAMPLSTEPLTVKNGETLAIYYRNDVGLYGNFTKADGTMFGIGELDYRFANGITVNSGGKILSFVDSTNSYIPYIINNGGDVLVANGSKITELSQTSGTTTFASGNFTINELQINGGTVTSPNGGTIKCDSLDISNATIENMPITCDGIILASGTVSISSVTVKSLLNQSSGTLTINGDVIANGDVNFGGTVTQNGTSFKLVGDLSGGSNTVTLGNLNVCGKLPQTISRQITVNDLNAANRKKLILNDKVYVQGEYITNGKITNEENVVFRGQIRNNTVFANLLIKDSDLIIDGCTVTAKKGVNLNGSLIIRNSGKLITKGLTLTNGNITISDNSELSVNAITNISNSSSKSFSVDSTSTVNLNKLAIINSMGNIAVDGLLKFGSDASLSSATLTGNGTIQLFGDLIGNSLTVNQPKNFEIVGKLPQEISASGASFYNLNISNPSRGGVKFNNTVYYCGDYTTNGSKVTGTVTAR